MMYIKYLILSYLQLFRYDHRAWAVEEDCYCEKAVSETSLAKALHEPCFLALP